MSERVGPTAWIAAAVISVAYCATWLGMIFLLAQCACGGCILR